MACLTVGGWVLSPAPRPAIAAPAPATADGAAPTALPTDFVDEAVFSGLTNPTQVEFATDGRVFVAEKSGRVLVFDSLVDSTPSVFADLRTQVHNFWDRGLLGLELHPDFPATPWVYVLYTHDAAMGGTAPRWGSPGQTGDGCPSPPGATGDGCVVSGRLSRLTASGNVSSGETVMLEDWCQQYPSHSIGDLAFGPDGALYVSGGDGASFNFVDYGQDGNPLNPCGDPPVGVGGSQSPPSAEGGALRSQDLRTPGDPTSLDGSVLRIDPATGAGLAGNPLIGSADANARRIIATGLRNPFRMAFRPNSSELWVGDVGWNTWEEVNRIVDTTPASVVNFGWPCYEGTGRQGGYDGANLSICESLYASGGVQAPHFAYRHDLDVAPPDDCPPAAPPAPVSSSITGVAFNGGSAYPGAYAGALFGADYSRNCIWVMTVGAGGVPDPATITAFQPDAQEPVGIEMGPDGWLYYADFGGQIRRIRYAPANLPPTAAVSATPSFGPAPLVVSFDASASTDPEQQALTYAWDLDDDGQFDDATGPTPTFTFTEPGQHRAHVRVQDPPGETDAATVTVQVDNALPALVITAPAAGTTWAVGDDIGFAATATDAQDGDLSGEIDWSLVLFHCSGATCHQHPITSWQNTPSGSVDAPDHEYPSYLELTATVSDTSGAGATVVRRLDPRTVDLTFRTVPAGLNLTVGGAAPAPTPFTRTVIVGSQNSISAPSPQVLGGTSYAFGSWSDGGSQAHQVVAPSGAATFTATYMAQPDPGCPSELPAITDAAWQRNGAAVVAGSTVQLTAPAEYQIGSVLYGSLLPSAGLRVCFEAQIGGGSGSGADGMTLLLLSPTTPASALGADGSGLGFGGLSGLAVALDTYDSGTGDPSANFVGIADAGTPDALHYLATSTAIPTLENAGPVAVEVAEVGGRLQVRVAGALVLDTAVSLPSQVRLGFSAATGGLTNRHTVGNVRVDAASGTPSPGFLVVSPSSVNFGSVTVGSSASATLVLSNTGGSPLTLSAVTLPGAPFGAPAPTISAGTVIPAGGSISQLVRFTPASSGPATGSLSVTPDTGQGALSVALSGTGLPAPTAGFLVVSPPSVNFGSVTVGSSASATLVLSNTGGSPLTLSAVTLPGAPFGAPAPTISAGTVIPAGGSISQLVRFTPASSGPATGSLSVTPDTGQGALSVALSGTGLPPPDPGCPSELPAITDAAWQRNGAAVVAGSTVQLTAPAEYQIGSVLYGSLLPSAGLRVCFEAQIGGGSGSGADGMTLLLLSPTTPASALGADGSGLGFGGLSGLAVALDTYDSGTGDPSANFVGIADAGTPDALHYLATSTAIPTLENAGPVAVEVAEVGGRLQVRVAGALVLDTAVSLPSQVRLGFSAATGGLTNRHTVGNVRVDAASGTPSPGFLVVSPSSVNFGSVTVGSSASATLVLSNTGGSPLTLSAVTLPGAPFGAPAPTISAGTVIPAGGSISQLVRFTPASSGPATGSLSVTPDTGQGALSVALSGTGLPAPTAGFLVVSPPSVNFGSVTVGSSASATLVLSNTGGSPLTLSAVTLPGAPFGAPAPTISAGTVIPAGGSISQLVRFTPASSGPATGSLSVTPDTGQGALSVALSGTGLPPPDPGCPSELPAITDAAWQRNGAAVVAGSTVQLTAPAEYQIGSVLYGSLLPSAGLRVCFEAQIGGGSGSGADGMTLLLLSPTTPASALGADGSGLGFGGLSGLAVALDTYDSGTGDPSANFVGIADAGTPDALHYLATSTAIPTLENAGPVAVEVAEVGGRLQVRVAGALVLDTAVSLPSQVRLGFSAATGGLTNRHTVGNVRVDAG